MPASLTHDEQRQAVDRIEQFGETAREAKDFIRGEEADQIEQETQKLWRLFTRTSREGRVRFLKKIDDNASAPETIADIKDLKAKLRDMMSKNIALKDRIRTLEHDLAKTKDAEDVNAEDTST